MQCRVASYIVGRFPVPVDPGSNVRSISTHTYNVTYLCYYNKVERSNLVTSF